MPKYTEVNMDLQKKINDYINNNVNNIDELQNRYDKIITSPYFGDFIHSQFVVDLITKMYKYHPCYNHTDEIKNYLMDKN